jgi:hypothetical protein
VVAEAAVAALAAVAAAAAKQVAAAGGIGPPPPVVEFHHRRSHLKVHIPLGNCAESCTGQLQLCATRSCLTELQGMVKIK